MTTIKSGSVVLSTTGQFVHIARDAFKTVCGKDIDRLYPRQDTEADCRVCTRKGPR